MSGSVDLWALLAISAAVAKIISTVYGLALKRDGQLFSTVNGWVIYLISKISSIALPFFAYCWSVVHHDADLQVIFGWITGLAAILAIFVAGRQIMAVIGARTR